MYSISHIYNVQNYFCSYLIFKVWVLRVFKIIVYLKIFKLMI